MPFSEKVAFLVTERRGLMWCVVALIVVASLTILIVFLRLDTEVLNLLPRGFDSVQGLKIYNSEFAQTRELTLPYFAKRRMWTSWKNSRRNSLKDCAPNRGACGCWQVRRWKHPMACAICNELPFRSC